MVIIVILANKSDHRVVAIKILLFLWCLRDKHMVCCKLGIIAWDYHAYYNNYYLHNNDLFGKHVNTGKHTC